MRAQTGQPKAITHKRTHLPTLPARIALAFADVPLDGIRLQIISQLLQDSLQGIEPAGEVIPIARKLM
jgi:hypothetical protein